MAKKIFYVYNPHTLSYERVTPTSRDKWFAILRNTVISVVLGTIFFFVLEYWLQSPMERIREQEIQYLNAQCDLQTKRLDNAFKVLNNMRRRDESIYRLMLQAEPLEVDTTLEYSKKYDLFMNMNNGALIQNNAQRIDLLERILYAQSQSYDELIHLFKNKEERLRKIPAILPINIKDLKEVGSGFGVRIDPIYKTPRMHSGMDFRARTGALVYATGEGVVTDVGWMQDYGNCVLINHGFGYMTRYAHLNEIKTKRGASIKRGDVVGTVGATGKATGSHLHYEVILKGKPINPVRYYFLDLTPEEYEEVVRISSTTGKVYD